MERGSNFSWYDDQGGIAASSQDIRTMIEAVHVLDRQAGGIQMGVVKQENGRTQSPMSDMRSSKSM